MSEHTNGRLTPQYVDKLPADVLHPMQGIQYQGILYVREEDCRASLNAALKKTTVARYELIEALRELRATVRGECPSLLNEDSGGNAKLDSRILDLLAKYSPEIK